MVRARSSTAGRGRRSRRTPRSAGAAVEGQRGRRRGGGRAAAHGAFHRGRPPGVGPRPGEVQPGTAVAAPGRWAPGAGRGAERGRALPGDDGVDDACAAPRPGTTRPARSAISAIERLGPARQVEVGGRQRDGEHWPLVAPGRLGAVEHELHGESTTAANARSVTRRSNTRWTLTIGDVPSRPARRRAPGRPAAAAPAAASWGTASDDGVGGEAAPSPATTASRVAALDALDGGAGAHLDARPRRAPRRRRLGVEPAERHAGPADVGRRRRRSSRPVRNTWRPGRARPRRRAG